MNQIFLLIFSNLLLFSQVESRDLEQVRWYGYFVHGSQVGYSNLSYSVTQTREEKFYYKKKYRFIKNASSEEETFQINVVLSDDFSVRSSHHRICRGGKSQEFIITTGGGITIQLEGRLVTLPEKKFYIDIEDFLLYLMQKEPVIGRRYHTSFLSSNNESLVSLTVVYSGTGKVSEQNREVPCHIFKVTTGEWRDFWATVNVDSKGFLISSELGGVTVIRIDSEEAQRIRRLRDPIPAILIYDPHEITQMDIAFNQGDLNLPQNTPYYKKDANKFTLYPVSLSSTLSREQVSSSYLVQEQRIPSNNPSIIGFSQRISGADRDPKIKAHRLASWISGHFKDTSSPVGKELRRILGSPPEAEPLACVSLARAMNIPARIVSGLVYYPGVFRYHSWAELYLDGWTPLDEGKLGVAARYLPIYTGVTWSQLKDTPQLELNILAFSRGAVRVDIQDLKTTMLRKEDRIEDILLGISFLRPQDWAVLPKNPWTDLIILRSLSGKGPSVILKVMTSDKEPDYPMLEQMQSRVVSGLQDITVISKSRKEVDGKVVIEMQLEARDSTGEKLSYNLALLKRGEKVILSVLISSSPMDRDVLKSYNSIVYSIR